jgi:hypothetical protein
MLWSEFKSEIIARHARCTDTTVRVRDIQLRAALDDGYKLPLKAGNTIIHTTTQQGITSLLSRFGISYAFFSKCSPQLKTQILKEFLTKFQAEHLLLRTFAVPDSADISHNVLRFAGSTKYDVYNDVDAVKALSPYVGDDIKIHRPHVFTDRTEFMVLLSQEPLKVVRDFGVAVRIVNSETGLSSLRVTPMVMELKCTNGLMIPKAHTESFVRTHLNRAGSQDSMLHRFMDGFIPRVGELAERVQGRLEALTKISAKAVFDRIIDSKKVPQYAISDASKRLRNYGDTGLDAISALTEVARDAETAEQREHLQEFAGYLTFNDNK